MGPTPALRARFLQPGNMCFHLPSQRSWCQPKFDRHRWLLGPLPLCGSVIYEKPIEVLKNQYWFLSVSMGFMHIIIGNKELAFVFQYSLWSLSKSTQIVWQQLTEHAREDIRSWVVWKLRGSQSCDVATACYAAWDKGTCCTPQGLGKVRGRQVSREGVCLRHCRRLWVQDSVTSWVCWENYLSQMNTPFQCETFFALGFLVIPVTALWH